MADSKEYGSWYSKHDADRVEVLARFTDPADGKERVVFKGRTGGAGYEVYSKTAFDDHYLPYRPLLQGALYWSPGERAFYLPTEEVEDCSVVMRFRTVAGRHAEEVLLSAVPADAVEVTWQHSGNRFTLTERARKP